MNRKQSLERWEKGKDDWNGWARSCLALRKRLEKIKEELEEKKEELEEKKEELEKEKKRLNKVIEHWMEWASVDFSGHDFRGHADFIGFVFPHTVDFSAVTSTEGEPEKKVIFTGEANFTDAIFNGDANFYKAIFDGDANFYGALFKGKADFLGAVFNGNTYFSVGHSTDKGKPLKKATFTEEVNFSKVNFIFRADFGFVTFPKKADFSNTSFGKPTEDPSALDTGGVASFYHAGVPLTPNFEHAHFEEEVYFSEATFFRSAIFENARFEKHAFFSGATFGIVVSFKKSKFIGGVDFTGTGPKKVTFPGETDFSGARFVKRTDFFKESFGRRANFSGATFINNVNFSNFTFPKTADFSDATFHEEANFSDACFKEKADFSGAIFVKKAESSNATLEGKVNFQGCEFRGVTLFDDARFIGDTSFSYARSDSLFSMADARFRQVPDFIQMSFSAPARMDNLTIKRTRFDRDKSTKWLVRVWHYIFKGNKDRAAKWRALKKLAIDSADHDRELYFFAGELHERKGGDGLWWLARWLLGLFYWLFSNYGRGIILPFFWWGVQFWGFACIYRGFAESPDQGPDGVLSYFCCIYRWFAANSDCMPLWQEAFSLSWSNSFPLIRLGMGEQIEQASQYLYGSKELPLCIYTLTIIQMLLGSLLIFLILLGLRNNFRIK